VNKVFRILSIDGGGIRGVFPAHILNCISKKLGVNILQSFDFIAGTSTGSIIAAAIASEIDLEKTILMYKERGCEIFKRRRSLWPQKYSFAIHSTYEIRKLEKILKEVFGDVTLGDIKIPLLLPATDVGLGGVHVLKSSYSPDFTRDKGRFLWEAVMASCAAPIFFDPVKVGEYLLADGGLWANNPSFAAVIDAHHRLHIELADIRILSLGTGHSKKAYGVNQNRKWGIMNGWEKKKFIEFILMLQTQATSNYLKLLLHKDQIMRLDFETDMPLPLDDCSIIDDIISRADQVFTYNTPELKRFFEVD